MVAALRVHGISILQRFHKVCLVTFVCFSSTGGVNVSDVEW